MSRLLNEHQNIWHNHVSPGESRFGAARQRLAGMPLEIPPSDLGKRPKGAASSRNCATSSGQAADEAGAQIKIARGAAAVDHRAHLDLT
jgi:hypothetical protein